MTKQEFLDGLQESLENGLDSRAVMENMAYYRSYIEEEIRRGKSEEEVLGELGDPWVIAQSVIGMEEHRLSVGEEYGEEYAYTGSGEGRDGRDGRDGRQGYPHMQMHVHTVGGWWKSLLFVLGLVGILLIVFAVIGGLLSLVMPMLFPILLVVTLIRLIQRRR